MKLRVLVGLGMLALLAMPAFGRSFGYPNEVVNGGFENGLEGWTKTGNFGTFNSGDWGVPAPEGAKYGGFITNWGSNQRGEVIQWVDNTQSPGWNPDLNQKAIDLEFWALLHARHFGSTWENVWLDVLIDWVDPTGQTREELVFRASNLSLANNDIAWVPVHVDFLIPDSQPAEISLHIILTNRDGMEWSYAFIDGIDLESRCVPEPASMGLLLLGLPLLVRRRHA